MSKQIFVNLPVKDLAKSTAFYTALGFKLNPDFSNSDASCVIWSEEIFFMLLTHDFYAKFTSKTIIDAKTTSGALIALGLDSKEEVQKFADTAKASGGSWFEAEPNKGLDFMFGLEVSDIDGNTIEPFFMDVSKFPGADSK
jgi:predicted lactoylglutathione lyase